MNTVFRVFAWLLAAAIVFVTLAPIGYRPNSGLNKDAEHLLALLLVGLVFGLAYPRHRPIAAGVSVVALAVLETLQLVVLGRDARLEDFAVKSTRLMRRDCDRRRDLLGHAIALAREVALNSRASRVLS